ncbi:MAG: hypothetical protein MH204_01510 [Fimbriimonadaceae bacterium]|nr:hypothetical protein [Fimbriimonadaceae bacterium]
MKVGLECELARVQMKRYLAGEELPQVLVEGLESHVRVCASCRRHLDRQRLRLADELAGRKGTPNDEPGDESPVGPAGAQVFTTPQKWRALVQPKPLLLSLGLAAVLVVMSIVARDPGTLFGPKASDRLTRTASTAPEKAPEPAVEPGAHEEEHSDHPAEETPAPGHSEDEADSGHGEDKPPVYEKTDSGAYVAEDEKGWSITSRPPAGAAVVRPGSEPKEEPKDEPRKEPEARPEPPKADDAASSPPALIVAEEGAPPRVKPSTPRTPPARPRPAPVRRRTSRPAARPAARPTPRPAAKPRSGGIAVYDSAGRRIK